MLFTKLFKKKFQKKLEKILIFREYQQDIINQKSNQYNLPVVTINLNIPGFKKNKKKYWLFFQYYVSCLLNELNHNFEIIEASLIYQKINFFAFFILNERDAKKIKYQLLTFEDTYSSVMRIFDLDVYDENLSKISRSNLKYPERTCFICSHPAKQCARQKKHSLKILLEYIDLIIDKEHDVSSWKFKLKK